MKRDNKEFGARLKEKRLLRNYTIDELSEKLNISSSYLSLLERGDRKPSYTLLLKIYDVLGVSLDELMFGKTEPSTNDAAHITLNENEIAALRRNPHWMGIDKEIALGLAVGRVIKQYGFDEDKLSYISAALFYTACQLCDKANQ